MSLAFPLIPRQLARRSAAHATCRTTSCRWHGLDMLLSLGACPGCGQPLTRVDQAGDR